MISNVCLFHADLQIPDVTLGASIQVLNLLYVKSIIESNVFRGLLYILCDFSRLVVCDMMPRGRKQYSWEFDN